MGCGAGEVCEQGRPGVMLGFDDYDITWEENLDLFARHEARVTFYPMGEWLRDEGETRARLGLLQAAGHDFGVHTVRHRRAAREYLLHRQQWLEEDVLVAKATMEQALGREVRAFAYPRGEHTNMTDRVLFEHFDLLRGFRQQVEVYSEGEFKETPRFIQSTSIDNRWSRTDAFYTEALDTLAASRCEVWPISTHRIGESTWAIARERLDYLLGEIRARDLAFYVPADFVGPGLPEDPAL